MPRNVKDSIPFTILTIIGNAKECEGLYTLHKSG